MDDGTCENCKVILKGWVALYKGNRLICYDCACTQEVRIDDKPCPQAGCTRTDDHLHDPLVYDAVSRVVEESSSVAEESSSVPREEPFEAPDQGAASTQHTASAESVLQIATGTLYERGRHYTSDEERNMKLVVEVYNRLTGRTLTTVDGWHFMLVLKMVRAAQDPEFKLDHYVDLAGYAALAAEEGLKATHVPTQGPTHKTLPHLEERQS